MMIGKLTIFEKITGRAIHILIKIITYFLEDKK